jgi:hypothetical protein
MEIATGRADYYAARFHEEASNFFDQACLWPKYSATEADRKDHAFAASRLRVKSPPGIEASNACV